MNSFESAFEIVKGLVQDFKENEKKYLSAEYQEAEVRRDFIDKFFEALGWDVYHNIQKNPYEQEVKVEKGVSVGKAQKRADYAFFISPEFRQPKFFAEAKKPSRNLKNADDYYQTIRYGWNSGTPVAALTDFEEFHILDCRYKPNLKTVLDNPNHKSYHYSDYIIEEKFREIYHLFSREDVANNSLEKYAESFPKGKGKSKTVFKSGIQTIDDDFLEYIDKVRENLAKAFKKNDTKLSSEELTEATQRTIDRIVFIRFLEDKLIEPEYYISEFGKRGNAWSEFISVCRKLDAKYNGIVFKKHFIDEQNFQGPEQSTFKKICDEMSYLNSPYDFNAIPIHILGSIYERFLGKVVNATAQRVKVEEKPEVRKAGGVYYTPKYIVDYIVDNTVGKILRNESGVCHPGEGREPLTGKTPAEISKLRFADIACGSGSFLIGVFETLLKYHTEYYQSHPEQAKKDGCIEKDGQWILSIKQKQSILLNNIYGVDIDNQAVEVTQLSLALKMLEDETGATANEMQALFHEKILPDLSRNIVCGNSLIGTDILEGKMFPTEEERKLNPMDFEKRFPHIFCHSGEGRNPENNGFDAIVGNPPYVLELSNTEKKYFNYKFNTAQGKLDLFRLFIEKAYLLNKNNGYFGYIIPSSLLTIPSGSILRKYILQNSDVISIVKFWGLVFKNANVNTSVLLTQKGKNLIAINVYLDKANTPDYSSLSNSLSSHKEFKLEDWFDDSQNVFNTEHNNNISKLINKITTESDLLGNICEYTLGMQVYHNSMHSKKDIEDRIYHSDVRKNNTYYPESGGRNLQRYYFVNNFKEFVSYGEWCYNRPDWKFCTGPRIVIREISGAHNLICAYTDIEHIPNKATIIVRHLNNDNFYLLGILNSKLIGFFVNSTTEKGNQKLFPRISLTSIRNLPIKLFNQNNNSEIHDRIIEYVKQLLISKIDYHSSKTEKDKSYFDRKCEDLDNAIDDEVYKLYGLTEEEIKIVEGKE